MNRSDPGYTVAEVAALLGVGRSTVLRLNQQGALGDPMKLPGATGAYLFDRADVERLREQRTAGAR